MSGLILAIFIVHFHTLMVSGFDLSSLTGVLTNMNKKPPAETSSACQQNVDDDLMNIAFCLALGKDCHEASPKIPFGLGDSAQQIIAGAIPSNAKSLTKSPIVCKMVHQFCCLAKQSKLLGNPVAAAATAFTGGGTSGGAAGVLGGMLGGLTGGSSSGGSSGGGLNPASVLAAFG